MDGPKHRCPMCRFERRLTPDGLCGGCSYEIGTLDPPIEKTHDDSDMIAKRIAIVRDAKRMIGGEGLTPDRLNELLPY